MSSTATELDTRTPDPARAYDHVLGGKEAFACDRELVARVTALYPPGVPGPKELAARNRAFLKRAVSSAVHDGIGQVLDLGAGFPAPKPLHAVAKEARETARVAYVDIDHRAAGHGRVAVEAIPGVTYAEADLTRPGDVMACPDVREVIDPSRPVLAVLGLVLGTMPAGAAGRVVEGWARWLPSGSRFAVTVASWSDAALYEKIAAALGPRVPLHNHSEIQLAGMLRGLEPLNGGIVVARGWGPEALEQSGPGRILGVVARKP